MAVNASFKSVKDSMSLDELAEDGLVTIEVGCLTESNGEFRASRVLSLVGQSKLSTLGVTHGQVLILKTKAKSTEILLANASSRDAKS